MILWLYVPDRSQDEVVWWHKAVGEKGGRKCNECIFFWLEKSHSTAQQVEEWFTAERDEQGVKSEILLDHQGHLDFMLITGFGWNIKACGELIVAASHHTVCPYSILYWLAGEQWFLEHNEKKKRANTETVLLRREEKRLSERENSI